MTATPYWLEEAARITQKQRDAWRAKGFTLSKTDDSWPIPDLSYLDKAISSWGRAVAAGNQSAVKRHMLRRARDLGASKEKIAQIQALGTQSKEAGVATNLPITNRLFRLELGRALVESRTFASDMAVAAAKALGGDPIFEADRSHDQIRMAVSQELRDRYRKNDDDFGPWIKEIFDDKVVWEHDGDTWQSTYTIDDDENVTLGERVEVEIRYVPVVVPTSESGEGIPTDMVLLREAMVPLVEKALRRDDTVGLKLIATGRGSSGYYSSDVLDQDGAAAFPKGTKMYWDHPTESEAKERPERSLRDLAAELTSNARYEEAGADGPGLYADAKVFGGFKEAVDELAPHIGVSINAGGFINENATADDGQAGVVERIYPTPFNSVDFVTAPGAGGMVQQLFESARGRGTVPAPRKEEPQMDELKEAQRKLSEAETVLAEAQKDKAAAEKERDEAVQERDRLREAGVIREARDAAHAVFDKLKEDSSVDLPQMTRARLGEALSKNPPTTDEGALDKAAFEKQVAEAVKAEAKYLAEVTGSGRVTGLGLSTNGENPEKVTEHLEAAFARMGLTESAAKAAAQGRS